LDNETRLAVLSLAVGVALVDVAALPDLVPTGPQVGRPEPHAPPAGGGDLKERVLESAMACVARFGLSKTTLEDVAREARLSRATLYRLFPGGRDDVVGSMLRREIDGYFAAVAERLVGIEDVGERIVVAMTAAAELLADHDGLRFMLAHEPETVLPYTSFHGFDQVLEAASAFFAPYLEEVLLPEDARRAAEWIARLVLSHVMCPAHCVVEAWDRPRTNSFRGAVGTPFALRPEPLSAERARWLTESFILPGIRALIVRARTVHDSTNRPEPAVTG
jgi:AcrR family transcriptional regulator